MSQEVVYDGDMIISDVTDDVAWLRLLSSFGNWEYYNGAKILRYGCNMETEFGLLV